MQTRALHRSRGDDSADSALLEGNDGGSARRFIELPAAGLLDAPAEDRFDRLTRLARRLVRTPVAAISLLDADRQFFLSAQGLPEPWASLREMPLSHSFCRLVVESELPLAVEDARRDPRVHGNPLIEAVGVIAYLGVPLALPDGCVVGALCAVDGEPRRWGAEDVQALTDLAGAVMAEFAAGLRLRELNDTSAALRESEALYRALFEISPQIVWFTDAAGRATYVNQYYTDFTGLPAEQAFGDGWIAAVHPEDRERVLKTWAASVASGADYTLEYRRRHNADGSYRWLLTRGAPLRGADGRVERWIGVATDVDDRRRAEEALRKLIEALGVAIYTTDAAGRLTFYNESAIALWGWRPPLGDTSWCGSWRLSWPDGAPMQHDECPMAIALRENQPIRGKEAVAERPDGTRVPFIAYPTTLRDEVGTCVGGVNVLVDITDRKQAAAALRDTQARLQELQAELLHVSRLSAAGTMASALAHELNQPLTATASAVRAAQRMLASLPGDASAPGEIREAMDLAAGQALRAGQIVRRLRDFVARDGEADTRLEDLAKLTEEAGALALVGARERGIQAEFRFDPLLPHVLVDRIQIQQVLLNLIRNALEAMMQDETGDDRAPPRRRELVVTAVAVGLDRVEVGVLDTGPGLAPEIAGRLFSSFVSTKPGGMGMGLSICRSIVEAHGGRLWAEANPGGGAVFRFTLPAVPLDATAS